MRTLSLFGLLLALLVACDEQTADPSGGEWLVAAHPCFGNRTDTLWVDDDSTVWVGCGSTTEGYGLFHSTDGGGTWSAPLTGPAGVFDDFRVSSISRSSDELLYVAGTGGANRVVSVDTAASPMAVNTVFASASQTWNSFHVGTFRRTPNGLAVAESLTGVDLAWRGSDADDFVDGYGWWGSNAAVQILDMVEHGGALYACGSTISQPPHLFVPPAVADSSFSFDSLPLTDTFVGELWGLDVDGGGIVAGGVDQDAAVGVIFTSPVDITTASQASLYRLDVAFPEDSTWVRGVCRDGQRVVAVGEFSQLDSGIVLQSTDGGLTFADITPDGAPPLHRCQILGGGTLVVSGAQGFYGSYAD